METQAENTPGRKRRLPPWLKRRIGTGAAAAEVAEILRGLGLTTVCQEAHCPNQHECFSRRVATFMILGDVCTRNCRFCAVAGGEPTPVRPDEPEAVAEAAVRLGLRHVVVTSVTRDDLADGGAGHFAGTIRAIRRRLPTAVVEVLTPDFGGNLAAVETAIRARPGVFNHNVETVPRLYPDVRPQADYGRSLGVLAHAKQAAGELDGTLFTKSGLMVGLGEEEDEVEQVLSDLRSVGCDLLTIGQYLAPSDSHAPVVRFVEPGEFDAWKRRAKRMGFRSVAAGPFVRSSYLAEQVLQEGLESHA